MRTRLSRQVLVLVLASFALSFAADAEAGRWKLSQSGCYWEPNDSGPDQCSPDSGRWKWSGSSCDWDANDSGPHQCDPNSPPANEARLDQAVAVVNELASAGWAIDAPIGSESEMEARVRSNVPMSRFPDEALELLLLSETIHVSAPALPPRYWVWPTYDFMPVAGQMIWVPVATAPPPRRLLTCEERNRQTAEMQKLAAALGVGALGWSGLATEARGIPRLQPHAIRFARAGWLHAVIGAMVQYFVLITKDAPCTPPGDA